MTKRKIEYWVIPPKQDAEFVACMEDVLETGMVQIAVVLGSRCVRLRARGGRE